MKENERTKKGKQKNCRSVCEREDYENEEVDVDVDDGDDGV